MHARLVPFPMVCVIAIGRIVLARELPVAPPADDPLKKALFIDLRAHERELREKAAQDFPTDPWSRDDAFHAYEGGRVEELSRKRHVPMIDVLDALDDGMRVQRAHGDRTMTPFVPPCHPRAIY